MVVPPLLGPANYGDFALAFAIVTVASASMAIGGPAVITRFVPAADPAEHDAVARALVGRLARWRIAQIAVVACAGVVMASAAPGTFSPLFTTLVVVAIACDAAAGLMFTAALGFGRAGLWSFQWFIHNAVVVVGAVVLFELFGRDGAIAAIAVASATTLAISARAVVPRLLAAPRGGEVPAGALRFGAVQALSGMLVQLQEGGGVVAVAVLNGSRVQTGFASIAIGAMLAPVWAVRQAFNVQLPSLVAAMGDDGAAPEAAARQAAHRLQLALLPPALVGAIFSDDLLRLVLGHRFHGAASAVSIALAALPLAPPIALGVQVAALRLKPEARLKALAAGAVTFLAVAALAVPGAGAAGAAAAVVAGAAVTLLGVAVTIPRTIGPRRVAFSAAAMGLVLTAGALL